MTTLDQMARLLKQAGLALEEITKDYVELLGTFITHIDGERRTLEAFLASGNVQLAGQWMASLEVLALDLQMIRTQLLTEEDENSAHE